MRNVSPSRFRPGGDHPRAGDDDHAPRPLGARPQGDERVVDDLPGAAQADRLDHALQAADVRGPVQPGQPVDRGVDLQASGSGQPQRLLQRVADRVARAAQADRLPVAGAVGGEPGDGAVRLGEDAVRLRAAAVDPRDQRHLCRCRPVGLVDHPHHHGAVTAAGPRLASGQAPVDELRRLRGIHRLGAVLVALRALGEIPDPRVAAGAVQLGVRLEAGQVRLPPAALDDRVRAVRPGDQQDPVVIDVVRAVAGADRRADPLRIGVAQQVARRVDRVHAHVHQTAAARQLRIGEPAGRAPGRVHAVAAGLDDLPQLAGLDPPPQRLDVGVEPPAVGDHQHPARRVRGRDHRLGLLQRGRHRLLDQHVLARLQAGDRLLGVQAVRRAHHHGIDLRVGGQLAPVGGRAGDAVALGERGQRLRPPVGRARDLGARMLLHAAGVEVHDPAGSEQGDAQGHRQPFTPDRVTPSMNTRCAAKKITITGSMKISAAAIVRFHCTWCSVLNEDSARDSVCESGFCPR